MPRARAAGDAGHEVLWATNQPSCPLVGAAGLNVVGAVLAIPGVTHAYGGAVPAAYLNEAGELLSELWAGHGVRTPACAGSYDSGYLDTCPTWVQTQPLDHIGARQPLRPLTSTGEPAAALPAMVQDGDRTPLVCLTFGTVQDGTPVLPAAIRGLAGLRVRTLAAVGPGVGPAARRASCCGERPVHLVNHQQQRGATSHQTRATVGVSVRAASTEGVVTSLSPAGLVGLAVSRRRPARYCGCRRDH